MIRCPDNQINASFIDISRLNGQFFYCGRLSSAQLVPLQARSTGRLSARARSNRRHSGEASKTMDYKTVFINLCLELPQNLSWIQGLGKNPFTHSIPFTHSLTAVPFVRGHRSVFPRTPRNTGRVYTSSNVCHSHEWRVDTASGLTLKKQNACFTRCPTCGQKKNCVYTRPPNRRG